MDKPVTNRFDGNAYFDGDLPISFGPQRDMKKPAICHMDGDAI